MGRTPVIKNKEIKVKNKELVIKSREILDINKQLNQLVAERTQTIEGQNQRLVDFAYFNSHKVRGPLARIMGLVDLIKSSETEEERSLYLQKLEESSKELDTVIFEINDLLQESEEASLLN
ncbi:MAG: histidine kinase dimerization/phospho-acceptor domain-containing protein [Cytophagaceae bacterium]